MPTVPYKGYPEVSPIGGVGARQSGAGADIGAFGGLVGEAAQGLGSTIERAGDVLAKHAIKMKDEENTDEAKDAFLAADIKVGELDAWHRTLEGKAAKDALPDYTKKIMEIRQEGKNGLGNQDAQRKFDRDFARRAGYSIIDASRHAATQYRQYQNHQDDSIIALSTQNVAKDYGSDEAFSSGIENIKAASRAKSERQGVSPEQAELAEKTAVGNAWRMRLANMAIYDPERAQKLFEDKRGEITDAVNPNQLNDIERHVRQGINNLGASKAADRIFSKYSGQEGPGGLKAAHEEAEAEAEKTAPNDPDFKKNVLSRLDQMFARKKKAETDQENFQFDKVLDAVSGQKGQRGSLPSSEDELKAMDPEAYQYYLALPTKKRNQVRGVLTHNAEDDPPYTPEVASKITELKGKIINRPLEATQAEIMEAKIPKRDRGNLLVMLKNKEQQIQQTHLTHGLSVVHSMTVDARLSDKEMDQFTGSFLDAIQRFQTENKKLPTDKDYRDIGAKLLDIKEKGYIFNGPKLFLTPVPSKDADEIRQGWRAQFGTDPSDEQVRRYYIMKLLKNAS